MSKANSVFIIKSQHRQCCDGADTSKVVCCIVPPDFTRVDQIPRDSYACISEETLHEIAQSFCGTHELEALLMSGVSIKINSDNGKFVRLLTLDELHAIH